MKRLPEIGEENCKKAIEKHLTNIEMLLGKYFV